MGRHAAQGVGSASVSHQAAAGEGEMAMQTAEEALALAEPGGLLRLFVDEGAPMAALLGDGQGGAGIAVCTAGVGGV